MGNNNSSSSSGIGFFGLLFIVFLVLKLTNVIDWSWWWVSAPLWIPASLMLTIIIIAFIIETDWSFLKRFRKTPKVQEKPKHRFAAKLEKMQEEQEMIRRNNKERKIEQS